MCYKNAYFDIIVLDHNLSEITDERADNTGFEVASVLGNNKTMNDNAVIIIHLMNSEAVKHIWWKH